MQHSELSILLLNCIVIALAYLFVYPRFCGSDGFKIAKNDIAATGIVLVIAGFRYWGSGVEFNLLITRVNWFWFTFITYGAIEIPVMMWYYKKHDVWRGFD